MRILGNCSVAAVNLSSTLQNLIVQVEVETTLESELSDLCGTYLISYPHDKYMCGDKKQKLPTILGQN